MNIETLAKQAQRIIDRLPCYDWRVNTHGIEIQRGFFTIYNSESGQQKTVLYHPKSGYVFKEIGYDEPSNSSKRYVGEVTLDERRYRIRLPEYYHFETIAIQEYVYGETCCETQRGWCEHAYLVSEASGCGDAHAGNYRILNGEVVLFDFEGIDISSIN